MFSEPSGRIQSLLMDAGQFLKLFAKNTLSLIKVRIWFLKLPTKFIH